MGLLRIMFPLHQLEVTFLDVTVFSLKGMRWACLESCFLLDSDSKPEVYVKPLALNAHLYISYSSFPSHPRYLVLAHSGWHP